MFRTFIRYKAAPFKALHYTFFSTFYIAGLVSIFNTQDKFALVLLSKQVIIQCGTNSAQMQATCGTRRKTNSNIRHRKSVGTYPESPVRINDNIQSSGRAIDNFGYEAIKKGGNDHFRLSIVFTFNVLLHQVLRVWFVG